MIKIRRGIKNRGDDVIGRGEEERCASGDNKQQVPPLFYDVFVEFLGLKCLDSKGKRYFRVNGTFLTKNMISKKKLGQFFIFARTAKNVRKSQ